MAGEPSTCNEDIQFVTGRTSTIDEESVARTNSYLAATAASNSNSSNNPAAVAQASQAYVQADGPTQAAHTAAAVVTPAAAAASAPAKAPAKTAANKPAKNKKGKDGKAKPDLEDLTKEIEMDQHQMTVDELCARYNTHATMGMTSEAAAKALEQHGPNELTPPYMIPKWRMFLNQMFGGFATLLWIGSILCFIAYGIQNTGDEEVQPDNLYLGVVLAGVVICTGIFSFLQESSSADVMKNFAKLVPQKCTVWRDGAVQNDFGAAGLVPGDIVEVKYGDKMPADIRVLKASGLKVDNSSLTGESEPQKRDSEKTHDNPLETQNLAFFTTHVLEGSGVGMVVQTGDKSVIGRIKSLVEQTENLQTPIAKEIESFIHLITAIAVFLGVTFFILALIIGYNWLDAVIFLIGIIVANVPEGLLATVTVSLTLCAKRMATKNVLVKNLESVETLGSTSCICSDKTGTLTQNKMTVTHLCYDAEIKMLGLIEKEVTYNADDASFKALWRLGQLCNTAVFVYNDSSTKEMPHQERKTNGDASESGILKWADGMAAKHGLEESDAYRAANKKVVNIPFNSKDKYAASVHELDGGFGVCMKGAAERILDICDTILINGETVPMTDEYKGKLTHSVDTLGRMGERVLGFCQRTLDPQEFGPDFTFEQEAPYNNICKTTNFTFVGYMSLIDPPREQVPKAVADCKSASIQVIMVTGDHPITARAIARSVGIIDKDAETPEEVAIRRGLIKEESEFPALDEASRVACDEEAPSIVVNGTQLKNMSQAQLDNVLRHKQIVFARTSPQQKLMIVQGCQRKGHVVAVTGDGVNDSPALKAANIGIAMGIAGSDVSKEAADMILLDDDFSSIVKGVEEGRIIFDNLKKSIAYTLTSNIPEISPFLLFIILAIPLPLSTIMILAIDLGTDMYPAISLAYEAAESDIMMRRPRNAKTDNLVTARLLQMTYCQIGIIQALAGFFCYFVVMGDCGFLPDQLIGLRDDWDDEDNEAVTDSYGQVWGFESRKKVEYTAQTSYFVSIVIVQWADLIICKTRMLSIFQQKMKNRNLNFALFFETCLAAFLCYVPGMDAAFKTQPLFFVWWLPALPFSLLIWCYDETRRFLIRRHRRMYGKAGWVESETYW